MMKPTVAEAVNILVNMEHQILQIHHAYIYILLWECSRSLPFESFLVGAVYSIFCLTFGFKVKRVWGTAKQKVHMPVTSICLGEYE